MLDIFYPSIRAFVRDCRLCKQSPRGLLQEGIYCLNRTGGVFSRAFFG
jgi:hypothetical protein